MAEAAADPSIDEFSTSVTPGGGRKERQNMPERERNYSAGKVPVITCDHNNRRCKATTLSQLDINSRRIPTLPQPSRV